MSSSRSLSAYMPSMNMRCNCYFLLFAIPVVQSISSAEMASIYGLSIATFDTIIRSESGSDFGTSADSEELWLDATSRQWDFNGLGVLADLGPSNTYYPYVLCYSDPALSGFQRILALNDMFANAGVQVDQDVFIGGTLVNIKEERTCVWTSSLTTSYLQMIAASPDDMTQYLEVQPHMFSMKIVNGTSASVAKQMSEHGVTNEEFLGLAVSMCPVYSEYMKLGLVTYEDLINDYIQFLTQDGGMAVYNSSFYVAATEIYPSVPQGIQMWSDVIKNVVGRSDPVTGANRCLDVVITEKLNIRRDYGDIVSVFIEERDELMTAKEFEDCMWYVIAGLALHPYACQIEDEAYPVVLSPDSLPSTDVPSNTPETSLNGPTNMPEPSHASLTSSSTTIAFLGTLVSWLALVVF